MLYYYYIDGLSVLYYMERMVVFMYVRMMLLEKTFEWEDLLSVAVLLLLVCCRLCIIFVV
jgi:hypothetical protein